jgi:hypothetical protein
MVGGLSFIVAGSMCCGVAGTDLMVRVGREAVDRYLSQPHVKAMKFAGKALRGFVLVEPEGFRTERSLTMWVQRGLDFVGTLSSVGARKSMPARPRRNRSIAVTRQGRRS